LHNSRRPHLASWERQKKTIAVQTPFATLPAKPAVDLSFPRSHVFDRQIRRSAGTDHGFKKVDSRRAELVVSRITTTISIARQGPSAFLSLPAVPPCAVHAGGNLPPRYSPRHLLQLSAHCKTVPRLGANCNECERSVSGIHLHLDGWALPRDCGRIARSRNARSLRNEDGEWHHRGV
jgi:hypothetical protein